jgi:hypothetical protein
MKRIINHFFFCIILAIIIYSFDIAPPIQFQTSPNNDLSTDTIVMCDSTLWNHVYDPSRLTLVQDCIEVTGIVWEKPIAEGDADYHISIKLDNGQAFYLNQKNYELKDSCLVVEVVCAVKDMKRKGKVKTTLLYRLLYSDLPGVCDDYYNKIYIPKKGEHVKVSGPLIIDEGEYSIVEHGWQEIHPVNSIELIN